MAGGNQHDESKKSVGGEDNTPFNWRTNIFTSREQVSDALEAAKDFVERGRIISKANSDGL